MDGWIDRRQGWREGKREEEREGGQGKHLSSDAA